MVAGGVDVQLQFDGVDLGPLLVGRQNAGGCAGNGDCGGEIGVVGVQDVVAARSTGPGRPAGGPGDPFDAGDSLVALGPHPAQFGSETEGEVGGADAIEFE